MNFLKQGWEKGQGKLCDIVAKWAKENAFTYLNVGWAAAGFKRFEKPTGLPDAYSLHNKAIAKNFLFESKVGSAWQLLVVKILSLRTSNFEKTIF